MRYDEAAQCTLAGVELMHMIKKRQMAVAEENGLCRNFYVLTL
jgi:hypothetical protein